MNFLCEPIKFKQTNERKKFACPVPCHPRYFYTLSLYDFYIIRIDTYFFLSDKSLEYYSKNRAGDPYGVTSVT